MSQMRALKTIMKMSDKEIKENLEEIRLEKAIAAEPEKTAQIIKKTGIFDTVDRIYGEPGAEYMDDQQGGQGGMDDGGGAMDGLGAPGSEDTGDVQGQEGSMDTADMGQDPNAPMESRRSKRPLLVEQNKRLDSIFDKYMTTILEHNDSRNEVEFKRADVYDEKSLLVNEEFDKMINALNKFVEEK